MSEDPESICELCKGENVVWYAPSELWNKIARREDHSDPMLCPNCFIKMAETKGIDGQAWRIAPESDAGLKGRCEVLEDERRVAIAERDAFYVERNTLKAESDALKRERDVAKAEAAILRIDLNEMTHSLEASKRRGSDARAERDSLAAQLQQAREEKDRAIDDVVAKSLLKSPAYLKLEAERDAALAELKRWKERFGPAELRPMNLRFETIQKERDAALAELAEARKHVDRSLDAQAESDRRLFEARTEISLLKSRAETAEDHLTQREAQLSAANNQVQSLRRALGDVISGSYIRHYEGCALNSRGKFCNCGQKEMLAQARDALASAPASTSVRSDSERLDWLEKEGNPVVLTSPDMSNKNWLLRAPGCKGRYLTLRAAIDAAMSQRTGE